MSSKIAIIGAGITGLTLARYLYDRGIPVTVYEASDKAGGVMQSYREDGWLAEAGPHSFSIKSPRVESFLQDTGIADERVFASNAARHRYVVRDGRLHPVPSGISSILKTDLFSTRAKLRLLKEPFVRTPPPDYEETVGTFVRRRLGPEFLDYAINPFVAGIYAGDPDRLSLPHAFPRMHRLEQDYGSLLWGSVRGRFKRKQRDRKLPDQGRIFSFDEGLARLPQLLSEPLAKNIHYNTSLQGIQKGREQPWQLSILQNNETFTREHTTVFCTIPLHRLKDVQFEWEDNQPLRQLEKVSYPPLSVWTLGFHRSQVDHPLDGFGMLLPEKEERSILGTLFSSTLFPRRAPEDHVTLSTFVGGARQPKLAREPEDQQRERILNDLRDLLGAEGVPTFEHAVHWTRSIPQYNLGYGKVKRSVKQLETAHPGFHLAGNFRDGPSINDCMETALELGKSIRE